MDRARSNEKRLAPFAAEGRDIRGKSHNSGFEGIERAQAKRGNLEDYAELRPPLDGALDRLLGFRRITHQPHQDFGAGLIRNYVRRAAARDGADVERARAEERIGRQGDAPDFRKSVDQLMNSRIAEFGVRRMSHLPAGGHFVAQGAFRAERELVLCGLAVDEIARPARLLRRPASTSAVALLA